jgi:MFS family permease
MGLVAEVAPLGRANHNYVRPLYAWYVVVLLTMVHIVAYIDRYLLSLLVEPIKASLRLTDFQMGLLIGPAFAIFFVVLGLPLGWLADRKNRRTLLAVGIGLWSLMTAACGLVKSFAGLFIARMGVGIGEASAAPCTASLIADYFPPAMRPRAIGLWMTGAPVGAGGTYLLGGAVVAMITASPPLVLPVLGELYAWQTAFLVVGLPGLVLAALLRLTVKEPPRRERLTATGTQDGPTIGDAFRYFLTHRRSYGSVFAGIIGITAIGASSFWAPALFLRTWGWDVTQTGIAIGTVLLITGLIGTNLGGWLAARWTARGRPHGPYLTVFIGALLVFPSFVLFPLMPTGEAAVGLLFVGFLGMSITSGTSPSTIIAITPSELRGQMIALFWLVINLFGALVGPPMVGLITDGFGDPAALKYGVSITAACFGVMMNLALWWGLKHYRGSAVTMAKLASS